MTNFGDKLSFILPVAYKLDYWNDIKPVLSDVEAQIREGTNFKPGALFTTWIKQKAAHCGIVLYAQNEGKSQ